MVRTKAIPALVGICAHLCPSVVKLMSLSAQHLWLIPALPLAAAAVCALMPRSGRTLAAGIAIGAMGGSLLLSCLALAGA
ncbi:MAG: NADH-quinone oxidoreductase subunit, partial [Verrucomicrobiota bacterium]|nr:NADH-quinone oxidoreductase subunit [Verrucomicrobiota bacterium]